MSQKSLLREASTFFTLLFAVFTAVLPAKAVNVPATGQNIFNQAVSFTADSFLDPQTNTTKYRLKRNGSQQTPEIHTKYSEVLGANGQVLTVTELIDIHQNFETVVDLYMSNANKEIKSDSTTFNNGTTIQKAGVTAHAMFQQILNYFKTDFNWAGNDQGGTEPIRVIVVGGLNKNAFFNPNHRAYFLGINNDPNILPNISWDSIAHEFTHGIFTSTYSTLSNQTFENKIVLEGFGDILGTIVDHELSTGDWTYGEDLPDGVIRDLENPNNTQNPDTFNGTHFCVNENTCPSPHKNSTIISHWFYLLTSGGAGTNDLGNHYTVLGIGMDKAAQIAFKTLTDNDIDDNPATPNDKLTPTSGINDTRNLTLESAKFLYGETSPEYAAVMDAWHAVGVGPSANQSIMHEPNGRDNYNSWPTYFVKEIAYTGIETQWKFEISTDKNFPVNDTYTVKIDASPQTVYTQPLAPYRQYVKLGVHLQPKTKPKPYTYYWRVTTTAIKKDICFKDYQNCDKLTEMVSDIMSFTTDPKQAQIVSPAQGDVVHPWYSELSWNVVPGATGYEIQVCEDGDCENGNIILTQTVPATEREGKEIFILVLDGGQTYGARVRALGNPEIIHQTPTEGEWSETVKFDTNVPSTILSTPAYNANVNPWKIPFSWVGLPGADHYVIRFALDQNFTQPIPNANLNSPNGFQTSGTSLQISFPPQYHNTPIYWEVIPYAANGDVGTSEVGKFIPNYDLTKPTLLTPQNGGIVPYNQTVSFTWSAVANGNNTYLHSLTLADGTFVKDTSVQNATSTTVNASQSAQNLDQGYCWRVRANGPYQGTISDAFCYTVDAPKPVVTAPTSNQIIELKGPVTFTWTNVNNPSNGFTVDLQRETSPGTFSSVHQYQTASNVMTVAAPLADFQTYSNYRVRVAAVNGGNSSWSNFVTFSTVPQIDMPVLISPANGATDIAFDFASLTWQNTYSGYNASNNPDYPGAGFYITLKETVSGAFVADRVHIGNATYAAYFQLNPSTQYTWFIEAMRPDGTYVSSAQRTFTTIQNNVSNVTFTFTYTQPQSPVPVGSEYVFGLQMVKPDGTTVDIDNNGSTSLPSGTMFTCSSCQSGTYQFYLKVISTPNAIGLNDSMDIDLVPSVGQPVMDIHLQNGLQSNDFDQYLAGNTIGPFLYTLP